MSDTVDWKEFLTKRWKAHRDAFRVGGFEINGVGPVFASLDRTVQPATLFVAVLEPVKGLRAIKCDIMNAADTRSSIEQLATSAISGRIESSEIPFAEAMRTLGLVGASCPMAERSLKRFADAIDQPAIVARLPKPALLAKEIERYEAAGLGRIRSELDTRALDALKAVEDFRWIDYQFYKGDDERAEIRRQAAQSYPLLASFFVRRPSLRAAVDARRSLGDSLQAAFGRRIGDQQIANALRETKDGMTKPAICAKLGVPEKTLARWSSQFVGPGGRIKDSDDIRTTRDIASDRARAAAKVLEEARKAGGPITDAMKSAAEIPDEDRPLLGKGVLGRLVKLEWPTNGIPVETVLQSLAQLPPDWIPKTREDWDAFCDLTATIGTTLKQVTGLPLETLYQGCSGKWAEFRMRCSTAFTDTRPPEGLTELLEARLRAVIPFKDIAKLPRDKVRAAGMQVVSRMKVIAEGLDDEAIAALPPEFALPHNVLPEDVVTWLVRLHDPDESRHALAGACIVAEDMTIMFAQKVVLPLAANETGLSDVYLSPIQIQEATLAASRVLFAGKATPAIFEIARHFHTRIPYIAAAGGDEIAEAEVQIRRDEVARLAELNALGVPGVITEDGWPALFEPVQAPNGLWIVPLTEKSLLDQEGFPGYCVLGSNVNTDGSLGLRHCVGGYADSCRRRGHHIISIRRLLNEPGKPSFERLSTFEFTPGSTGDTKLQLRQHRGLNNGEAPEDSVRAYSWLLDQIKLGAIPINFAKMTEHFGALRRAVDELANLCSYDWRDRDRIYNAMKPWAKYVGKRYRNMGVDEFAKDPEVMTVARQIEPSTGLTAVRMRR